MALHFQGWGKHKNDGEAMALMVHNEVHGNLTVALKLVLYDCLELQILLRPWPDRPWFYLCSGSTWSHDLEIGATTLMKS